jgi:tRNA(fMet)-specific endonuclease VapC
MSGPCLLDTNAASGVIRNVVAVQNTVRESEGVYVPVVVLGELFYGAYKADTPERQTKRVEEFAAQVSVVYPDMETARIFGRIRRELSVPGQMIPVNDLWVAALALQFGLPVVTQDRHFDRVTGLSVVSW